jgi:excisionase family DNA binding protein
VSRTKELPKLLDISGMAEHLCVSERYVRRLVAERRIPYVKWGHYIRFDPAQVAVWLESATIEPRTEMSHW